MDARSETLRVVQLAGAIFINARFSAPWCYQSPAADIAAPFLEPGAERIIIFHVITEGECYVEMEDAPPIHVTAGDVLLFAQGDAHRMCSEPGVPAPTGARLQEILSRRPRKLIYGGGGTATKLVCGYLACDARPAKMLLTGLAPVVRVNMLGSRTGDWLMDSLQYGLAEARSPRPGGGALLAKLAEVLFIEVLREYMNEDHGERTGWLAGVNDRVVGAALKALHEKPAHPWSVSELAQVGCTSRSVLAERFQQLVGSSPIQYLTQWRMLMASKMLREGSAPLTRIAEEVGYQTDSAFSRAFRREFGVPPSSWRRNKAGVSAFQPPG